MNSATSGLMRKIDIFGKYLDQPALIKNISKKVPIVLIAGASYFGIYDTFNNKKVKQGKESKIKRFIKNACVLTATIASTLIFGKKFIHLPHIHKHDIEKVMNIVKDKKGFEKTTNLLEKIKKGEVLGLKQIKKLYEDLEKAEKKGNNLINKVIPIGHAHEHGNKHLPPEFHELVDLSILGLIPIVGGIAGGIAGDKLTGEDIKKTFPNKIKEGSYQYLANIVLCNVGAGAALFAMNKTGIKSRIGKFLGMLGGILAVGVAGGSFIANVIGKKVINPMFDENKVVHHKHRGVKEDLKNIYNERKPEPLDIALHIDDVASAGFLSGLSWIGPALPILYSVSAYRAGIGYRNNKEDNAKPASSKLNNKNDIFGNFRKRVREKSNFEKN